MIEQDEASLMTDAGHQRTGSVASTPAVAALKWPLSLPRHRFMLRRGDRTRLKLRDTRGVHADGGADRA